jgi:protein-tyrosine phosphatase
LKEAAAFGLVFDGHVPRRMDVEDIRKSDVVVGMARQHVREAVLLDKESFSRAFTLRELVRRGQEIGPWSTTEPLSEWLHKVHAGRRHIDLIGDSDLDDIADPMGGSLEDYRRMLSEVDTLVNALYTLIWAN